MLRLFVCGAAGLKCDVGLLLGPVDACTWVVFARYPLSVLISDRDIRQEIADGRIVLDPFDESMIQPASVDVRIDRFFRLFDNHKYPQY